MSSSANPYGNKDKPPAIALVPERFFLGACVGLLAGAAVVARNNLDPALLLVIYRGSEAESLLLWKSVTAIGSEWCLAPLVVLGAVVLNRYGRKQQALWLLAGFVLTIALDETLKWLFGRQRPPLPFLTSARGASFPSGHAAESLFVFYYLWIVFQGSSFWRRRDSFSLLARELISIVLAGLPAFIGYSRVWLGVHWPSDVLGGWGVGFFALEVAFLNTANEQRNPHSAAVSQPESTMKPQ